VINNKVKIGVVGLGMGRAHIEGFRSHPHAEVVALCDIDTHRLGAAAHDFEIDQTFENFETMLDQSDLDAVSIAVPNFLHHPLALKAFEAGQHVLCEKPIAITVSQGEEMVAAAKQAGKKLMVNFAFRFFPSCQALKRQVDRGALGEVYFGRTLWHRRRGIPGFGGWFGTKEKSGGGSLIDIGVHRLDLALWLMGDPQPVAVSGAVYGHLGREKAAGENQRFDVEDMGCGLIRFDNGATLILETSWALNIKEEEYTQTRLCGTSGGLMQKLVFTPSHKETGEIYTEQEGHLHTLTYDGSTCHVPSSYDEFVNCIGEDRDPSVTGEQAVKVQRIIEALYQSADSGREVRL
jgi:predicted dehydrogenase